jgi:hypothetical protein
MPVSGVVADFYVRRLVVAPGILFITAEFSQKIEAFAKAFWTFTGTQGFKRLFRELMDWTVFLDFYFAADAVVEKIKHEYCVVVVA